MTTYSGFELITIQPDWQSLSWTRKTTRIKTRLDNKVSQWADDSGGASAIGERGVRWVFDSRSEINDFRAFLDRCKGRQVPFWLPSWMYDLELVQAQVSADNALLIKFSQYTRFYAGTDFGRRHLAVILANQTIIPRRVVSASDNGNGTESLNLHTTFGADVPIDSMITFLTLCRMASDRVDIQWISFNQAIVEFTVREVPHEAPNV